MKQGIIALHICFHNAGLDQALERLCKQEGMHPSFKFTAPGTTQQNGKIQKKFTMLYNCVEAILNGGKFIPFLSNGLLDEAADIVTVLEIDKSRYCSPFQQYLGKRKRIAFTS